MCAIMAHMSRRSVQCSRSSRFTFSSTDQPIRVADVYVAIPASSGMLSSLCILVELFEADVEDPAGEHGEPVHLAVGAAAESHRSDSWRGEIVHVRGAKLHFISRTTARE